MERVALVTGGTRGIGRGIVESLLGHGVAVATTYHQDEAAAESLRRYGQESRAQLLVEKFDVTQLNQVAEFVRRTHQRFGRIDYLVNNVGADCCRPIADIAVKEWLDSADLILHAPFAFARAVVPIMRQQRFGRIINIGASYRNYTSAHAGFAPFSVFKGALGVCLI